MENSEARDHLRIVDDIIRSTDRTVRIPPAILVGVGAVCTIVTASMQAQRLGWTSAIDDFIQPLGWLAMVVVIGVTVWRRRAAGRETLIDRYAAWAFFSAFAFALILNLTAQNRVISPPGIGLIWAGSFSMALLVVGAMGSRVLLTGGLAMLATVGAAGLMGNWLEGTLAVAWFVGFVVPGILLALGNARG